nr:Protein Y39B6A.43, isoform b [Haemonchus contortus]
MIRSADELQGRQQTQLDHYGLEPGNSVHINGQCDSELGYSVGESLADIDDVADEVEVEHSDVAEWVHEKPHTLKSFAPANVLMTNDSLKSRPQLFVGAGPSTQDRGSTSMQWGDPGDIPSSSSDSQPIPGMKSLFKMYGEVAVRKAAQTPLIDGAVAEETEADKSGQYLNRDNNYEEILENNAPDEEFVALDPDQIYSKRKQTLHKYKSWPLYWDRPVDFHEASHILMGAIAVHESKVCTTIPQEFRGEGTFVINCENLDRSDSNNDGLGMWGRPNGRNRYYGHSSCGLFARMDDGRGNLLPDAKYIWKCMMRRYEHPMTTSVNRGQNRFIKKVYTALHPPDRKEVVSLIVITYEWIGKPFHFRTLPLPTRKRRDVLAAPILPPGSKDWQAASFQNGVMAALPATCSAYFGDCPLYAVGAIDFNAVASIILGGTIVEPSKICNKVPQGYRECGTFIIDLCNFVSDAELRRDDNGCWGKPAGNSRYYKIDSSTGDAVRVDRCCKLIEGAEYDVQILSKRYEHPLVNGRFVRKIYTARTPSNSRVYEPCMSLAVLTYYWKGEPEYFEAGPQRRVRMADAERSRLDMQYAAQSNQACFTDRTRAPSPPPKRSRFRVDEEGMGSSIQSIMYRTEYELQEHQANLLDRFEAFMDRLERISMCLPQVQEPLQQVWGGGAAHDDGSIAHEEEIIVEDGDFNEEFQ